MIPISRTCDVENLADFSRYYHNSWVGWHPSDGEFVQPCFISGAGGAGVLIRFMSKDKDGKFVMGDHASESWDKIKEHIDFGLPDIGMAQMGPTICFGSYTTPRSPRKGYRPLDVQTTDFNSWHIRNKFTLRFEDRNKYDHIWATFNPEYLSLEQAEDRLNKGEIVGAPVSRTLGVYTSPKILHSLLAYKRWTVGYVVNPYLIHIQKIYADYEEEISRQTGAEVIVR